MSPLVQNLLVAALIVGALAFLILRQLRKPKDGCGGGCGCSAAKKTPGS